MIKCLDHLPLSPRNRVGTAIALFFATTAMCVIQPQDCSVTSTCEEPVLGGAVGDLPLLSINNFQYAGAFSLPSDTYGESSLNNALGIIEQAGNSIFIVGHDHKDAIAEFVMPDLVNSQNIDDLNMASAPVQGFSQVLDRVNGGNSQGLDYINGMEEYKGALIVNAHKYYNASANNTHTTLIFDDASKVDSSTPRGYYELPGGPKSGGWMSPIPSAWQPVLGGTHITGYSSATSISARHSMGPSAHAVDMDNVLQASSSNRRISTNKLLEFSLDEPLHEDLFNDSRSNDLWTHTSGAVYGFIVPGTRSYVTVGWSSGHVNGVGYKITQNDGNQCGGYCARNTSDEYNYYWMWDVADLKKVKEGAMKASDVRPYSHGRFNVPFQTRDRLNKIGGGTFDPATGTLYLSVLKANATGRYSNPPVVVAYRFPGI